MKKEEYQELVDKHAPNEHRGMNLLRVFIIGGIVGALANFLIDIYSYWFNISGTEASTLMIITFIFIACLFTALGFFDKMVHFARMGLILPITGFAHSVQSSALDYKKEGFIHGLGTNIFKLAGSVLLYGIIGATFVALIKLLFMGG